MIGNEIVKLTRDGIAKLLRAREASDKKGDYTGADRRRTPRWPFPGTVEIRPAGGRNDELWFASCRDVGPTGLGMTCEQYFEPGTVLDVAVHLPEASLCGKATVRYCAELRRTGADEFAVGLEFIFDE